MSRHINIKSRVKKIARIFAHFVHITNYLDIILTSINTTRRPPDDLFDDLEKNGNPWKHQINTRDTFRWIYTLK